MSRLQTNAVTPLAPGEFLDESGDTLVLGPTREPSQKLGFEKTIVEYTDCCVKQDDLGCQAKAWLRVLAS